MPILEPSMPEMCEFFVRSNGKRLTQIMRMGQLDHLLERLHDLGPIVQHALAVEELDNVIDSFAVCAHGDVEDVAALVNALM